MTTEKKAQQIVLKNVRVKYAKLIRPGQAYDEGQPDLWSVNMYVNAEAKAQLTAVGATPKIDKEGGEYFIAKRNVVNKNREDVKPPILVDGRKEPFTEEVGNGSICNIAVTPFPWEKGRAGTPSYKTGVLIYLNAVQVVNHVPMSTGADAFEVIEEQAGASEGGKEDDDLPF